MITIVDLIKRDGRWWGGQNSNPKHEVVLSPRGTFLEYAKLMKRTEADRMLEREMNSPNQFLIDAPWVKPNRPTHRSSRSPKLYAVRASKGRFKYIQTYERLHQRDLMRKGQLAADPPITLPPGVISIAPGAINFSGPTELREIKTRRKAK